LNGEPIKVSETPQLGQSMVATGFPYDVHTNPHNNLDNFVRLYLVTQGIRHLGSAAQDLCYVAAGRLDAFWELRLNAWDVAAGGLIAAEAGAIVTNVRAEDYLAEPVSILAANPHLHGGSKLVNNLIDRR
jgi:myo-inositol-1(or 4)-monophosphatase